MSSVRFREVGDQDRINFLEPPRGLVRKFQNRRLWVGSGYDTEGKRWFSVYTRRLSEDGFIVEHGASYSEEVFRALIQMGQDLLAKEDRTLAFTVTVQIPEEERMTDPNSGTIVPKGEEQKVK